MEYNVLDVSELNTFEDDYYEPNRPVVIRGLAQRYPLQVFQWSRAYFEPIMGTQQVPVIESPTGFLSYERNMIQMPFSEFVARAFRTSERKSEAFYYFKNPTSLLPAGHDDSDRIDVLAPYLSKALLRNLWISGPGITVALHFDAAENFNFQLRGHKVFWLYPPGIKPYYPLSMFSQTAHISGIYRDGPTPDLSAFPNFDPAKAIRVELHAGDVLYLPAYWWHQVESLGQENVNLNFWWMPSTRKQLSNWNQALRGHLQLAARLLKLGSVQAAPKQRR